MDLIKFLGTGTGTLVDLHLSLKEQHDAEDAHEWTNYGPHASPEQGRWPHVRICDGCGAMDVWHYSGKDSKMTPVRYHY